MLDSAPIAPGYRLHKFELYNWGTFDSIKGTVHTVTPGGATTLLIGENGSGKSTIVDGLLTLLVRPQVRNYNVAAGAQKQERDERTYIKGAFDRRSRDDDNRSQIQFLRPEGRHYSALLATFRNDRNEAFTLAQVLYLNTEGDPEKVYCFGSGEKSIAKDCASLTTTEKVRQQMERRGFRATHTYVEYLGWLTKQTNIRPKAMDMFNQTVAVKDIKSLNDFIREHMLEAKPWKERIENLQRHFTELTDAHRCLVRVRKQYQLLDPIAKKGGAYRERAKELEVAENIWIASASFFHQRTVDLLVPQAESLEAELIGLKSTMRRFEGDIEGVRDEERRLQNEIDNAGGDRLREIPLLIDKHKTESRAKRETHQRFVSALTTAAIKTPIADDDGLRTLHQSLPDHLRTLDATIHAARQKRDDGVLARGETFKALSEDRRELEALGTRQSKLPESHAEIRFRLCEGLRLPETDLPFAAELLAVRPEERGWESSIEMVLRSFALSLLIPQRHYNAVSAYLDRHGVLDGRGAGQRLVYLRVAERQAPPRPRPVLSTDSLLKKLHIREGHAVIPWIKAELDDRFNYLCCDTIEQFQQAHDLALTRERHVKSRGVRHEKDDRVIASDPRRFVLGWDNKDKRKFLAQQIQKLQTDLADSDHQIDRLDFALAGMSARRVAIAQLQEHTSFAAMDFGSEEKAIASLIQERKTLEEADDSIQTLRRRLKTVQAGREKLQEELYKCVRSEATLTQDLRLAKDQTERARSALNEAQGSGEFERHAPLFPALDALLADEPLTPVNVLGRERPFRERLRGEVDRLRIAIEPLRDDLRKSMNAYLREFGEEASDLQATIEYLDSFCAVHDQIKRDDLPRHEQRFKERLNEKVIQEIGLLNGAFQSERSEIEQKIKVLNRSLKQLEYKPGTYMRLEPRAVRDPEVVDFQRVLRECLAGSFEGTLEADEARYMRIELLLVRLREEHRWREKVTDIRKWFDFAAHERTIDTEEERGYYEDSTGQSGGEKAKLAFTILVAAIAYQYDIDPSRPESGRLHFVVVDEMLSKADDKYSEYALQLFRQFGLQLFIVAPLDAKARVTEPYVACYLHVVKDPRTHHSQVYSMSAREFEEAVLSRKVVVPARGRAPSTHSP